MPGPISVMWITHPTGWDNLRPLLHPRAPSSVLS